MHKKKQNKKIIVGHFRGQMMKIIHTIYYFQFWKVVRIYIFILLFKEHLLNAKYVACTELSPGDLKIYLVGA